MDQWALPVGKRPERLLTRNGPEKLVVIPWLLGLFGRLDLEQMHIVDLAAVFPQTPLAEGEIVGRNLLHLRHDRRTALFSVVDTQSRDGLQVVQHARVAARLYRARL